MSENTKDLTAAPLAVLQTIAGRMNEVMKLAPPIDLDLDAKKLLRRIKAESQEIFADDPFTAEERQKLTPFVNKDVQAAWASQPAEEPEAEVAVPKVKSKAKPKAEPNAQPAEEPEAEVAVPKVKSKAKKITRSGILMKVLLNPSQNFASREELIKHSAEEYAKQANIANDDKNLKNHLWYAGMIVTGMIEAGLLKN